MTEQGDQGADQRSRAVDQDVLREYYDRQYYAGARPGMPNAHLRRLARRLRIGPSDRVLDIACGTGAWMRAAAECGASVAGIDLSSKATEAACRALPDADIRCGEAESLPWRAKQFDVVSCLGSLEHFADPKTALKEMMRVGKPGVRIVLLVPNAEFLTRKLGLFSGTDQVSVREDVRTLPEWSVLFEDAGLKVVMRWRDLHVLSWNWIARGKFYTWPTRLAQALALTVWPLKWQYQVYHLCRVTSDGDPKST